MYIRGQNERQLLSVDPDIPSITGFIGITQTSVTVSWSVGQTQHVNTILMYYRATGSEVWTYDPVTGNTHTVDSLLAGTQYQFYVQVNSYGKTSASENVTSTTGLTSCHFVFLLLCLEMLHE